MQGSQRKPNCTMTTRRVVLPRWGIKLFVFFFVALATLISVANK
jgi:hypothetical protein